MASKPEIEIGQIRTFDTPDGTPKDIFIVLEISGSYFRTSAYIKRLKNMSVSNYDYGYLKVVSHIIEGSDGD